MPQEKYKYMEIDIFIKFYCKDGYAKFNLCWHGWTNWKDPNQYNDGDGNENHDDVDNDENDLPKY